ncbi:MAG: tetratricopeptide repeat protein [bacterium]|nr:tetratricopeptide repeat protein [bacterium]
MTFILTVGCVSSEKKTYIGETVWWEQVEKRHLEESGVVYPFTATPEMRDFAAQIVGQTPTITVASQLTRLQRALFDKKVFHFLRDDRLTLTASEAFDVRRGNCFSFTALFITLARSLGHEVVMVSVQRPPAVKRDQGLVVYTQHIVAGYVEGQWLHMYDFFMTSQAEYESESFIDDVEATAMYHSNLGGHELAKGDMARAEEHLRIATAMDDELGSAWVNLGVMRYQAEDMPGALEAYRRALLVEPGMPSALTNIAYVYRSMGMDKEADAALAAAAEGQASPYALIALASAEVACGNTKAAGRHLRRAKRSFPYESEVYIALADYADLRGQERKSAKLREKAEALRLLSD